MAHAAEKQTDERENDELRSKRFRRGHADFGAGMHVNAAIAFARDCAGNIIANAERAVTLAPAFAQGAERVGSFTALAYGENERFRSHWTIAMTKLAGVLNIGRDVGQLFD